MAQWKRAGPITQRSVDRNYLLLFFSRISIEEDIETISSQVNERESGTIYTTLSQKNHNTRSRVLKIPNTSRMAQWKRAGPITQRSVDRNYLLLIFFSRISIEENAKQFPNKSTRENPAKFTLHCLGKITIQGLEFSKYLTPAGWRSGSVLGP